MAKSPPKKKQLKQKMTDGGLKLPKKPLDKGQKTLESAIEDGKVLEKAKAMKRKALGDKAFLVSLFY